MLELGSKPENASLMDLGIMDGKAHWNLPPDELIALAIRNEGARRTRSGAIAVDTGEFTGRAPKDKFIVKDSITESEVWWGNVNASFDAEKFDQLYIKMIRYFEGKEFFVRDCYACADWRYRMAFRRMATASMIPGVSGTWMAILMPSSKCITGEDRSCSGR